MNAIAAKARAAAATFEAKKDGLRQTQDGLWKLTLTVIDLPSWLLTASMGTRLQVAVVEIADDETPVEHAKGDDLTPIALAPLSAETVAKVREHIGSMSRETRREAGAATAAVDTHHPKNTAASERFRALGKPEQMVSRCAMLCADHGFQNWLGVDGAEDAARKVRLKCRVNSRSELASSPEAQRIWEQMVTDYDLWRGAIPEQRG